MVWQVDKAMRFDSYHPIIHFIYFTIVVLCTACFKHPVFLGISLVCSFLYSVKLAGIRVIPLNIILILLALGYGFWFMSYEHFGTSVIGINGIGNKITRESLYFGLTGGITFSALGIWWICICKVVTTDKLAYLLGRIFPCFSLYFALFLRMLPEIKRKASAMEEGREGIGKGVRQGNIVKRLIYLRVLFSSLIIRGIEGFLEKSDSMRSRGYSLPKRTCFSIYRFDNRDRGFLIFLFFLITIVGIGAACQETAVSFDPVIVMGPVTGLSLICYLSYASFLLLPMAVQIREEYRFSKSIKKGALLL